MSTRTVVGVVMGLALLVGTPALAADPVTRCGAKKLKATGTLFKVLYTEATKACVAGSAGQPQPVDAAKINAAVAQANAAFAAADAEFGVQNCYDSGVDGTTVAASAQNIANRLCLVPMP